MQNEWKRKTRIAELKQFKKSLSYNLDAVAIQIKLERLENLYTEFDEVQTEFENASTTEDEFMQKYEVRKEINKLYEELKIILRKLEEGRDCIPPLDEDASVDNEDSSSISDADSVHSDAWLNQLTEDSDSNDDLPLESTEKAPSIENEETISTVINEQRSFGDIYRSISLPSESIDQQDAHQFENSQTSSLHEEVLVEQPNDSENSGENSIVLKSIADQSKRKSVANSIRTSVAELKIDSNVVNSDELLPIEQDKSYNAKDSFEEIADFFDSVEPPVPPDKVPIATSPINELLSAKKPPVSPDNESPFICAPIKEDSTVQDPPVPPDEAQITTLLINEFPSDVKPPVPPDKFRRSPYTLRKSCYQTSKECLCDTPKLCSNIGELAGIRKRQNDLKERFRQAHRGTVCDIDTMYRSLDSDFESYSRLQSTTCGETTASLLAPQCIKEAVNGTKGLIANEYEEQLCTG